MTPITLSLPLRTTNPLNGQTGNSRVAAAIRTRQRRKIRSDTVMIAGPQLRCVDRRAMPPLLVTLTRLSAGTMDDDGLAASLKAVRDGIAFVLGIDDGDRERLKFAYDQRKVPRGGFGVEVRIESRAAAALERTGT